MIKHIAIIMDGNRRWATARGLPTFMGHRQGVETVGEVTKYCLQHNIPHLTLYAFSAENLIKRSAQEKEYLFQLIGTHLVEASKEMREQEVRLRFVGDRDLFPSSVHEAIMQAERDTAHNTRLMIDMLFCYGGQQEIVATAQQFARNVQQGTSIDSLTPDTFAKLLWSAPMPPPDLIIRTGGQHRLSNFLLFQCAYAELYFTETFWPAFTQQELDTIVQEYLKRSRNFGA